MQKKTSEASAAKKGLGGWVAIGLIFIGLLCSCTTPNYGKLQSSFDVTQLFYDAQILPDHSYYYSGMQGLPNAIIGIHPNYSLRAKAWQRIDFTSPTLKKWITRMSYVHLVNPAGAWILSPDGNKIGIWFSARRQTVIRLDKDNHVVIIPPEPPELRGVP